MGLILLPLLFLVPGLALLSLNQRGTVPWWRPRLSNLADAVFISIAFSGWIGILAAEAGLFTQPALATGCLILSTGLYFTARWVNGRRTQKMGDQVAPPTASHNSELAQAMLPAVLCLILVSGVYWPPVQPLIGDDPAVSTCADGVRLARTGGFDSDGGSTDLPFFPVWIGILWFMGGIKTATATSVFFATLSLAVIYRFSALFSGRRWFGLMTMMMLGMNYIQIWHGKTGHSEIAAQFLILSSAHFSLKAHTVHQKEGSWPPGMLIASGVCLGTACLTEATLALLVIPAFLMLFMFQALLATGRMKATAVILLSVLPFWTHAVAHALGFTALFPRIIEKSRELFPLIPVPSAETAMAWPLWLTLFTPFMTGAIISAPCAVLLIRYGRHRGSRAMGIACCCGAALVAHHVLFFASQPPMLGETLRWMSWYITLPILLLLTCGIILLIVRSVRCRSPFDAAGIFIPLAVTSALHFFYQPFHIPLHPLASKRFIVVIIPAALLVVALIARWIGSVIPFKSLTMIWAVLFGSLVALSLVNSLPMIVGRPGHDTDEILARIAASVTDARSSVLIFEPSLADLQLHTILDAIHGLNTIQLIETDESLIEFTRQVQQISNSGFRPLLVVEEGRFTPDPRWITIGQQDELQVCFTLLPSRPGRLPSSVVTRMIRLRFFQVLPQASAEFSSNRASPKPISSTAHEIDVGLYESDWPFIGQGFHGTDTRQDTSYRWTEGDAVLRLPAGTRRLDLLIGAYRPKSMDPAILRIGTRTDPGRVHAVLPRSGLSLLHYEIPADQGESDGMIEVLLESTTFNSPQFPEAMPRQLGIQLQRMTIH